MFKQWLLNFIVKKVMNAALKKADVTEYVIKAAAMADTYLDKTLGQKVSEEVQTAICIWINQTVAAFITELKKDQ